MTMEFVTFEIAKKLKEKGFKDECFAYYLPNNSELCYNITHYRGVIVTDCLNSFNSYIDGCVTSDYIDAPTISQVLKWLREKKKIHIGFGYSPRKKWRYVVMYMDDRFYNKPTLTVDGFLKIEQAAIEGIEYVLDNLI